MKCLREIFIAFFLLLSQEGLLAGKSAENTYCPVDANNQPVYIYYFYFVPRCEECIILEQALVKVLDNHYSGELKNQRLVFKKINLSDPDPESKKIMQELRVRRQLLLLVNGDVVVNLTRDAFRFSEKQYERFRDIMKESIDQALAQ